MSKGEISMCICLPQVYCHLAINIYVMVGSVRFCEIIFREYNNQHWESPFKTDRIMSSSVGMIVLL